MLGENTRLLSMRSSVPASEGQTLSRTDRVVFSSEATSLSRIQDEHVQLVVWRREKVPTFVSVLSDASLPASALPSFMGETTPGKLVQSMTETLRSQQGRALSDSQIGELVEDIDKLTGIFVDLSGSEKIYVRLETLEDNGCSFWHPGLCSLQTRHHIQRAVHAMGSSRAFRGDPPPSKVRQCACREFAAQ